jgi:hypothetical protein
VLLASDPLISASPRRGPVAISTQIRAYFRFTRHPPARTPGQLLTGNLDLPAELRSSSFDRTQLNIRLDTLTNG